MNPEFQQLQSQALDVLCAERASAIGRGVGPAERLTLFREQILGRDTFDLLKLVPAFKYEPNRERPRPTQDEALSWLDQHRPNIGAIERLTAARELMSSGIPDLTPRPDRATERAKQSHDHRSKRAAEKREYMKQFSHRTE